ncbi:MULTISPECIES: hypothetical protein [Streptomyces]|uniref:hypothetical protein n=1 Tax=Streptomyces TaxID=1883 RepID=UPI0035A92C45
MRHLLAGAPGPPSGGPKDPPSSFREGPPEPKAIVGGLEQYEDLSRLCYVRGPEGIIVGLAEQPG